MIKEAYCSLEVAKLLEEKGFNKDYPKGDCTQIACTHQMAKAWLREVHNLFIEPTVGETNGKTWYSFDIIPINGRKVAWKHYNNFPFVECNSSEEAVEIALKYTLENLI